MTVSPPAASDASYLGRFGNLIRDARKHRGLTQTQLAERLGTSQSAINRIEKGHQNLSLEMLARIGSALDSEIVALGAGLTHGLGFGANATATLITRGLAEMTRYAVKMGADPLTFQGLAGVAIGVDADLITVLAAQKSVERNRQVLLSSVAQAYLGAVMGQQLVELARTQLQTDIRQDIQAPHMQGQFASA